MGYFSQRKKQERENTFLKIMLIIFGIISLELVMPRSLVPAFLEAYLFQLYIINLLLTVFSFYAGRWAYGFMFLLFLLVGYTRIASAANLFIPETVEEEHHLNLVYSPHKPLEVTGHGLVVVRSGHLNLSRGIQARFVTVEKNLHVFTVIEVDLAKATAKNRRSALRHLEVFVKMQDDPVIIIGDFGEPVWTAPMKKFLANTQLKVKNSLILADSAHTFNPFAVPRFYVLGYKNVGLSALEVSRDAARYPFPLVKAQLGYY